jgi:hypothetical protein
LGKHVNYSSVFPQRIVAVITVLLAMLAFSSWNVTASWASERLHSSTEQPRTRSPAFATTLDYVANFYPLWFTYYQSQLGNGNRLVGPERVTPAYKVVVLINVDTLYASTFLNLTAEPIILIIPPTPVTYSILTLDPYGSIFDSGLVAGTPGTYALTGPGFSGKIPRGVTPISIPLNFSTLIFRADKFSPTGENQIKEADDFRRSLQMQTLSDYKAGKPAAATLILPVEAFVLPFKTEADRLVEFRPIEFLKQLQEAVHAPNTPPFSPREQALSDQFDSLFGDGTFGAAKTLQFSAGARAAHGLIVDRYLSFRGQTNWIHFTNIGHWGRQVVERAGITEFCQYCNDIEAAAYYHAFRDKKGRLLDGTDPRGYVLHIPKSKIPEAKRFWSFTAYTPDAVELVRNDARKYAVARYTPGLQYNADGSVTIYLARELPKGVPQANWLPVPSGPFNVALRVYGPEGSVADNTYIPPGIRKN